MCFDFLALILRCAQYTECESCRERNREFASEIAHELSIQQLPLVILRRHTKMSSVILKGMLFQPVSNQAVFLLAEIVISHVAVSVEHSFKN
jgi:hypothetical protein